MLLFLMLYLMLCLLEERKNIEETSINRSLGERLGCIIFSLLPESFLEWEISLDIFVQGQSKPQRTRPKISGAAQTSISSITFEIKRNFFTLQSLPCLHLSGVLHAEPLRLLQAGDCRTGRATVPAPAADLPHYLRLRNCRHRSDGNDLRPTCWWLDSCLDNNNSWHTWLRRRGSTSDQRLLLLQSPLQLRTWELVQVIFNLSLFMD